MMDENFEIIEIAFTVIAPRPSQELVDFGVLALLLFRHDVVL
jgi:hypothetical protein